MTRRTQFGLFTWIGGQPWDGRGFGPSTTWLLFILPLPVAAIVIATLVLLGAIA